MWEGWRSIYPGEVPQGIQVLRGPRVGSSKAADRLSNRTAAYFMKATSQDFKEPDKPQKKRKSVCAATAGSAYKITALADQASGLSSGEDTY
jgi:hypothetical protein